MKKYILRIAQIIALIVLTVGICFADFYLFENIEIPTQEIEVEINTEIPVVSTNDSLIITSPTESAFISGEETVIFSGVCDTKYILTINDVIIETSENGEFSYVYNLSVGENKIVISNGELTFEYIITYSYKIINSVSPTGSMTADGGMELAISAEALKDSKVYAVIGKDTVPMEVSTTGDKYDTYQAVYILPTAAGKNINLGKITFVAENNGKQEKVFGANITIKAFSVANVNVETGQGTVVNPALDSSGAVSLLSPNDDHQKGMATVCTVNVDYAETVPGNTADDKSDPECTPLLKGTVDYVKSECSYDGTDYYVLLSGLKVEKKNVSSFNGYVMPTNTLSLYNGYTSGDHTDAVITMNWKVPFTSALKNQSYYTGYSGRRFNVSSFTSSYIDFKFRYTNAAEGSLSFPSSSVVSSAEWVNIGSDGTTTLRVYLKNAGKFYGYKAYFSNDNRLVLQFNEKPNSTGATVVLDPGHGGKDCGAIGVNGIYESHLNLSLALSVKADLESKGFNVIILRTSDTAKSLDERQALARSKGGDVFVALHHNSSPNPSLSGTEVYYYRAFSKQLASSIHSRLANEWRSVYSDNAEMHNKVVADDGGVRFYPFRVTRIEECPAVLVECGYLSNAVECEYACNDDVRLRMAKAISQGVADYFANA